jgi:hypothetical protein
VFATLIRTAQRWSRIAVSDLERHQLRLLRQELGIDPPPTSKEDTRTEETIAHELTPSRLQTNQDLTLGGGGGDGESVARHRSDEDDDVG